jgi:basic membrane protein A
MLAASGQRVVIGVGFIFTDDVLQVAADYPGVSFACVDMALRPGAVLPANVVALKFREEEGSFLTGVLAAMVSETKSLGFVGGMDTPLIHKFSAGFRAGIRAACPSCKLSVLFAGATPNAFKDPGKGREMALSQFQNGADIVFHAAGATGLGVFQAARDSRRLAIGVDSDQSAEAPDAILTSMVKRIDTAVLDTIRDAKAGHLQGGIRWLGLKEHGLQLAKNGHNQHFFTAEREAAIAAYTAQIIAGEIQVPDHD